MTRWTAFQDPYLLFRDDIYVIPFARMYISQAER